MSKIVTKTMVISPSPSNDVEKYRIRVVPKDNVVTYETVYYETSKDNLSVDVSKIPALTNANGLYDFFVSAVDTVGNESDFVGSPSVAIDFEPPAPPAGISFSVS
jgi:hypothetical protein